MCFDSSMKHACRHPVCLVFFLSLAQALLALEADAKPHRLELDSWVASVEPSTLSVRGERRLNDSLLGAEADEPGLLALMAPREKAQAQILEANSKKMYIRIGTEGLDAEFRVDGDRLHLVLTSSKAQSVLFDVMPDSQSLPPWGLPLSTAEALLLPLGEGVFVPARNAFWLKRLGSAKLRMPGGDAQQAGELAAPFWGYDLRGVEGTASFIMHTHDRTRLHIDAGAGNNAALTSSLSHKFLDGSELVPFELSIALTAKTPIAPALHYRRYLQEKGALKTLAERAKENPELHKLVGAMHAYMWGDGCTEKALLDLQTFGIDRMRLGYVSHWPSEAGDVSANEPQCSMNADYIKKAEALGFLVQPRDLSSVVSAQNELSGGAWRPLERPARFFEKSLATPDVARAHYDYAFRIPLIQAAFHDTQISTDPFDVPHNKFPNLIGRREMLELLYAVPPMWSLDQDEIKFESVRLKRLGAFFKKLHEKTAFEALTDFKWLKADKSVQQTEFSNGVRVVANFSRHYSHGVPRRSVGLFLPGEERAQVYQP